MSLHTLYVQPEQPEVRISQRAPQRCTECSRRRVRCSKDLPCDTCVRRSTAHLCRREIVIVHGRVENAEESEDSEDEEQKEGTESCISAHRINQLVLENRQLDFMLRQYQSRFGPIAESKVTTAQIGQIFSSHELYSPVSWHETKFSFSNDSRGNPSPPSYGNILTSMIKNDPSILESDSDHPLYMIPSGLRPSSVLQTTGQSLGAGTPPIRDLSISSVENKPTIGDIIKIGVTLPASFTPFAEFLDDHVSIVAITQGWDAIEAQVELDPQWRVLKMLDQSHLWSRPADRLAVMRLSRIVTKFYAAPDKTDPIVYQCMLNYLRPTPSQMVVDHAPVIDYIAWPSFRDRLIFNQHLIYNPDFWNTFMNAVRFRWEDPLSDCFFRNPTTSMFQLKNEFVSRLEDINSWCLMSDFTNLFPAFEHDAPKYYIGPMLVQPSQRLLVRAMLEDDLVQRFRKKKLKNIEVKLKVEGHIKHEGIVQNPMEKRR